jgi:hypothetical protein
VVLWRTPTQHLNQERLQVLSPHHFRARQPYPWVAVENSLTPEGFETLRQNLPDVARFTKMVGVKRAYGQGPHDRFLLHYRPLRDLAGPWKEFIAELQSDTYLSFLRRMLGPRKFILTCEWYYASEDRTVSPHCDAARKLATHIFYFNTANDWDQSGAARFSFSTASGASAPILRRASMI